MAWFSTFAPWLAAEPQPFSTLSVKFFRPSASLFAATVGVRRDGWGRPLLDSQPGVLEAAVPDGREGQRNLVAVVAEVGSAG